MGADMSQQDYVMLKKNDRHLVISKDRANYTALYNYGSYICGNKSIAKVDFMNYFNKDISYKIGRNDYIAKYSYDNKYRKYANNKSMIETYTSIIERTKEEMRKLEEQLERYNSYVSGYEQSNKDILNNQD